MTWVVMAVTPFLSQTDASYPLTLLSNILQKTNISPLFYYHSSISISLLSKFQISLFLNKGCVKLFKSMRRIVKNPEAVHGNFYLHTSFQDRQKTFWQPFAWPTLSYKRILDQLMQHRVIKRDKAIRYEETIINVISTFALTSTSEPTEPRSTMDLKDQLF